MPYSLIFTYSNGDAGEIKPLACDNPKSEYGFEDLSIKRKADLLVGQLNKSNTDLKCFVRHY